MAHRENGFHELELTQVTRQFKRSHSVLEFKVPHRDADGDVITLVDNARHSNAAVDLRPLLPPPRRAPSVPPPPIAVRRRAPLPPRPQTPVIALAKSTVSTKLPVPIASEPRISVVQPARSKLPSIAPVVRTLDVLPVVEQARESRKQPASAQDLSDWLEPVTIPLQKPADETRVHIALPTHIASSTHVASSKKPSRIEPMLWAGGGALAMFLVTSIWRALTPSTAPTAQIAPATMCVEPARATATGNATKPSAITKANAHRTRSAAVTPAAQLNANIPTVSLASLPLLADGAEAPTVNLLGSAPTQAASKPSSRAIESRADRRAMVRAVSNAIQASSCESGSARATVTFAASGDVRGVRLTNTSIDKTTAACVRRAITRTQVAAFSGPPTTISKTVTW